MKPWKTVLGLGAACAACCAIPFLGGTALAAALWACADELLPVALLLLALSAVWLWRRRAASRPAACGCESSCGTGHGNACR